MVRRLSAFALAFVTLGAPVMGAMCQMTCASREAGVATGRGRHHACPPATPSAGVVMNVVMNSVPHACGHSSDETTATAQPRQEVAPSAAIVVWAPLVPDGDPPAGSVRASRLERSPPGHLALITQLRV